MKIIVTGSTGFIGREICLSLASQGHTVQALCRDPKHPLLPKSEHIIPVVGNILEKESLLAAMRDCEQVYHTAALAKMWIRKRSDFYDVNVTGVKNVLDAARACGVQKIVHTSTCGVWGPTLKYPISETDPRITGFPIDYERTKYLAELAIKPYIEEGMQVVIVNPSRVFGRGPVTDSNTVGKMIRAYLKGIWRINPANGRQVSNYAFLDDVVQGHIAAMHRGLSGHRYILGGEDISFNTFFQMLGDLSPKKYKTVRVSAGLIKLFARLEKLKSIITGLPPYILPEIAERLRYDQKYSSQKAIEQLGYAITPFATGLKKTIDHYKCNGYV